MLFRSPEPALVPPAAGGPVSPTDATGEIAGSDTTAAMTRSELDLEADPVVPVPEPDAIDAPTAAPAASTPVPPISTLGTPTSSPDELTVPTLDGDSKEAAASTDPDVHDELAALVERTPQKPAPTDDAPLAVAARGAKGAPSADLSRRDRRKQRKAAKANAKSSVRPPASAGPRGTSPSGPPAGQPGPQPERRRRWLPVLFSVLVIGALGGVAYLAYVLFQTPKHEIPAVVGLPQDEALDLVDDFKWDISVSNGRSDEYSTPGEVIRVTPDAGEDLAEGSPLMLTVSEGPEYRAVPDLADMPLADAQAEIERLRLTAATPTEEFSETVPAGAVISASVDGVAVGDNVLPGAQVNIVVSSGPQQRRVPQLRGLTVEQGTQLLSDLGLVIAVGEPVFDVEIPAGEIAVQTPVPDTNIDRDSTITVSESKGPDLVTMPDLTGRNLAEIGQLLTDGGLQLDALVGSLSGTFISASIDGEAVSAGDQVLRGSLIDIIILPQ